MKKRWSKQDEAYLKSHQDLSRKELAHHFGVTERAIKRKEQNLNLPVRKFQEGSLPNRIGVAEKVSYEQQLARKDRVIKEYKVKEEIYQGQLETMRHELDAAVFFSKTPVIPFEIKSHTSAKGEATIVAVASDWHIEECVEKETVNGRNEYSLEISKDRASKFFSTLLRLIQIEQTATRIDHLILALLGDFITNDIHIEVAESTLLDPNDAIKRAEQYLMSGLDFLLKNTKLQITVVCQSGNHGRTTERVRHGHEAGHSLEFLMYHFLTRHYRDEKRIKFIIPNSYLYYLKVYETTLAFHHGHDVRFAGGIGGLTVPMLKAISQWNRMTPADIYVCGHFHQFIDGNSFIVNGSMIGYNAYAVAIKATFERPSQTVFGVHSKLGKIFTRQIYF